MRSALNMLSTNVVIANPARPSGPGSASGLGMNRTRVASAPAVGTGLERASVAVVDSITISHLPRDPRGGAPSDRLVAMSTSPQTPPDAPGVTHDWVDAGGLRMHVALAGPADAPPLLMVHGWPQHWYCWRDVIPALAGRYRIIAPDLRGHGWTDAPHDGYAKPQLAADLVALLDALGVDKVTWLGHDWGAQTGWITAFEHPERIERLVACCVPPIFNRDRSPRTLLFVIGYQGPISTPVLGSILVRRGLARKVLEVARVKGEWTEEELAIYDDIFRARPHVTVDLYRTFLLRELPKLARGPYKAQDLKVPATVLVGDRDRITRSVTSELYPEVTVVRAPGVGHFLPEEDPDTVIAALS